MTALIVGSKDTANLCEPGCKKVQGGPYKTWLEKLTERRPMKLSVALIAMLLSTPLFAAAPSKLVLKNQFGEESINVNVGAVVPISASGNLLILNGATAPVDGTTGDNIAAKGSLYIAKDTGALYYNSGIITAPVWTAIGAGTTSTLLTGFSSGAGTVSGADTVLQGFNKLVGNTQNLAVINNLLTGLSVSAGVVASTDTVLQGFNKVGGSVADLKNGKFTPTSETVSAAGALSTTAMESVVANASGAGIAVTLAAPSSQDGQLKIIKMTTATNPVTLAMTNIAMSGGYTPTGTTTLTFSITGQSAVLMAVGSKWVYLGGSAIAS